MRFRKVIILRNGFGLTRATAPLIGIILINAITLNAQVALPGATRPDAPVIPQHNDRIIPLLAPLADQASLSADLSFAVRAQAQAATLLWPYDRERARAIYRHAFHSLLVIHDSTCNGRHISEALSLRRPSRSFIAAITSENLRVELLREIAGRDAGLAEDLARAFTFSVAGASAGCASVAISGSRNYDSGPVFNASPSADSNQSDAQRRDLLVSLALQIAERDPMRAMALAQLSLAFGVSPHFSRLLLSLRAADAGRADLLFAHAVGCLERSRGVDLNGLHTLGAFLVSATDAIAKKPVESGVVVRFLNCALAQLTRRGPMAGRRGDVPAKQGIDAEDEAVIYFIGRQLGDLVARYMPDRLGQFNRKIAELTAANGNDRPVAPTQVNASNPNEIAREARAASPADRDLLYARAAFAWLARGEVSRAQAAAAEVVAAAIRDRLMTQIARRHGSAGRLDAAVAVTRLIEDAAARASLLTSLARTELDKLDRLDKKDGSRGIDLLDEAASCALQPQPSMARALALSGIAGSFTEFDARRGFEVMQMAVETINKVMAPGEAFEPERSNSGAPQEYEPGELDGSRFEDTFEALGRADFERALSLAQQLAATDISVLAQLAVCRGALDRHA